MATKPRFIPGLALLLFVTQAAGAAENGWVSLFDGKSLDGWTVRGGHASYKVEDGTIVGTTGKGGPNTFLCRGPYGDFELELDVLCDTPLNSGVQIRSHVYERDTPLQSNPKRVRKAGEVYGYQCEIAEHSRGTAGNFWDEARRTRWLDDWANKAEARNAYKDGQWNHYRIVAQGKRVRSWVNGIACADFEDDLDQSGFIGLQVHTIKAGTGPYQVRWKNIRVRELSSATSQPAAKTTTKTFPYKTTPQATLEAVVHFPPGWKATDRRPAIVFFFGGGWTNGRITQFASQAERLAALGMVAVRADYRVKSRHSVTPDRCVEDAKSAIRWVRKHAAELGVDPDRIVASGGSAGGHIAACTFFTEGLDAPGEDHAVSARPSVLVLFNPVLSFEGVPTLLERVGNDEAVARQISPTRHLAKNAPPTILFYGDKDRLMAQGKNYMKRAGELGVRCELFTAEDKGHGFSNREPWLERTSTRMVEFLQSLGYVPAPSAGD
jgi:acetyl esterase/lipase